METLEQGWQDFRKKVIHEAVDSEMLDQMKMVFMSGALTFMTILDGIPLEANANDQQSIDGINKAAKIRGELLGYHLNRHTQAINEVNSRN